MAARKCIVGHDSAPQWGPGFSAYEAVMKYPLEIENELRGAQLMVVGFPRERDLKFRLGILFPAMICRLDYADETHTNSIDGVLLRAVPYAVQGPHYHSWPLNRRFFRGVTLPQTLLDAGPYDAGPYNEPGRLTQFCVGSVPTRA